MRKKSVNQKTRTIARQEDLDKDFEDDEEGSSVNIEDTGFEENNHLAMVKEMVNKKNHKKIDAGRFT